MTFTLDLKFSKSLLFSSKGEISPKRRVLYKKNFAAAGERNELFSNRSNSFFTGSRIATGTCLTEHRTGLTVASNSNFRLSTRQPMQKVFLTKTVLRQNIGGMFFCCTCVNVLHMYCNKLKLFGCSNSYQRNCSKINDLEHFYIVKAVC